MALPICSGALIRGPEFAAGGPITEAAAWSYRGFGGAGRGSRGDHVIVAHNSNFGLNSIAQI
jgi:hypothetical protein